MPRLMPSNASTHVRCLQLNIFICGHFDDIFRPVCLLSLAFKWNAWKLQETNVIFSGRGLRCDVAVKCFKMTCGELRYNHHQFDVS